MREILFRGKRIQGGDWVEGYFFKSDINKRARESGKATLIFTPHCDTFITVPECHNSFMVVSDTVGQYTGLKDKNGKRIFEGDILRSCYDNLYPDDGSIEVVKWLLNGWHIQQGEYPPDAMDGDGVMPYSEVIGNIHDNPELLKK